MLTSQTDSASDEQSARRPAWTVLLIGGSSAAGKTTIANLIGRRYGINVAQADTYRLLAERAVEGADRFTRRDASQSCTDRCAMLIERACTMQSLLEIVTAYHVATRAPLILEGDCVHPAMAAARLHAGVPVAPHLRAVFVLDHDAQSLKQKQRNRGRGFTLLSDVAQSNSVSGDLQYAAWLEAEARARGAPIMQTGPGESARALAERIVGLLKLDQILATGEIAAAGR